MTDRERIIQFLTDHPEWVDAYRLVNPRMNIILGWDKGSGKPYVTSITGIRPILDGNAALTIPPEGEWRPLPKPETFEMDMVSIDPVYVSYGSSDTRDDRQRALKADRRFAGHRVKVTVEAIS